MGINCFWDVIKEVEEVVNVAQLAERHYNQYGRPLRIAIDEADWVFNNVTEAQVYAIRESLFNLVLPFGLSLTDIHSVGSALPRDSEAYLLSSLPSSGPQYRYNFRKRWSEKAVEKRQTWGQQSQV